MSYATLLLAATCLASLVCADIHIRPGSLGGDGSQARPYATLGEGRDAARSILPETTGQVQLILHAGTHILSSTLELGPADSGRPGSPVVWRAAEGARPVISGGRPVGGWILSDPAKRKKYDELGPNWKQGAEFRPPPGGAGRRGGFNGTGQEFHFGGTGFSDFFEQMFGGRVNGADSFRRGGFTPEKFAERGANVEGDLLVTLDEALRGSLRVVSIWLLRPNSTRN